MADKNLIEQMLEHLVNEDQQKAEELFHEYVVSKSREIYESLIESEISDEDDEEKDEDESVEENFEDVAFEADDEEDEVDGFGGDATDDLESDLDAGDEFGSEEGEESEEEIMQDLGEIIDELQAKFDALTASEEEQGEFDMDDEEGANDSFGDEEDVKDDFDLETVREYVEKVPAGHGAEKKGAAEKADNTKSLVDNMKNDMGGTTANILSSKEDAATYANQGALKGTGLEKGKVGDNPDAKGNVNVPGGNAGKTGFKTKEAGHGAEKKGSAESADNKQSLFRGRR
jgi:hypothetical protein